MGLAKYIADHTNSTKGIFVALMGWAGAAQLPGAQRIIRPMLEKHPRLAPVLWSLTAAGFLLLNPRVQARLKALTGIDLEAEQKKLAESQQNIQQVRQDLKNAGQQAKGAMPDGRKQDGKTNPKA